MSYGKATVGVGTPEQREIEIKDFARLHIKSGKIIEIATLDEDDSIIVSVKNHETDKQPIQANIWLSKQSFIEMIASSFFYIKLKGESMGDVFDQLMENDEFEYEVSENLESLIPPQ